MCRGVSPEECRGHALSLLALLLPRPCSYVHTGREVGWCCSGSVSRGGRRRTDVWLTPIVLGANLLNLGADEHLQLRPLEPTLTRYRNLFQSLGQLRRDRLASAEGCADGGGNGVTCGRVASLWWRWRRRAAGVGGVGSAAHPSAPMWLLCGPSLTLSTRRRGGARPQTKRWREQFGA